MSELKNNNDEKTIKHLVKFLVEEESILPKRVWMNEMAGDVHE